MLKFWRNNHFTKVLLVLNTSSSLLNLLVVKSLLWALPWSRNSWMASRFPTISLGKWASFFVVVVFFVPRKELAVLNFRTPFLTFLPCVRVSLFQVSWIIWKLSMHIIDSVLLTVVFSFFFLFSFLVGFSVFCLNLIVCISCIWNWLAKALNRYPKIRLNR